MAWLADLGAGQRLQARKLLGQTLKIGEFPMKNTELGLLNAPVMEDGIARALGHEDVLTPVTTESQDSA